ncbi:MAG: Rpn family recombination-promoting nuclease/putative transposase [Acidobacteriota bacterium]
MADHDKGYKLLFSHAAVVADVLRGFVKEDWVREVDFGSLERVDGTFVSRDLRSRDSDMIWRVRWAGGHLYIYLMLEFQSSVEPFMAVRSMTYLGLLYEDLIRRRELAPSGKLPPVFVLVLYNGIRPWNAALEVADLVEPVPGGIEAYRPRFRYALLDETRIPEMELESERNVAAALFRLEKSRDLDDLRRAVGRLAGLQVDEELRKSVYVWMTQVLMPARFPGLQVPEAHSLEEIQTMLAERVMEWTREWKEEGRQEGVQEFLLSQMEARFGPVPARIRQSVGEIQDPEELKRLGKRLFSASSLEDLGLG